MLLDFLLPPLCLGCRRLLREPPASPEVPPLCGACRLDLGHLTPGTHRQDDIEACFLYEGPLAAAIAQFKFEGHLELAGPLGRLLAGAPILRERWDLVAPAPLHWRRALLRGYNQAALLARWALRAAPPGPRLDLRLLRRTRATPAQTALDAPARRHNLRGAIAVRRAPLPPGLRVLVLDDVTTTGATLRACIDALRAAGAERAAGLALLRTPL